ncbi:MAG: ATP synthase F1 subunit epsilon [Candidatus Xiphinematobacter sp.]|nr:MAG: ATP synthase F1 subunit epsilon [Candidatus Xiphinematobacter sp.]
MDKLLLELVTPSERVFSGEVEAVVIPGAEGELGILPGHCPLLTEIIPGELCFRRDDMESRLAVGEGFAEILPNRVSVLTDLAVSEENIDEKKVEEAVHRAEAAMREGHMKEEELVFVRASLEKSVAQLRLKRRRHAKGGKNPVS